MKLREYDVIELMEDLPTEKLRKGTKGAILLILNDGDAYECEFPGADGKPISESTTVTLLPKQFAVVPDSQ